MNDVRHDPNHTLQPSGSFLIAWGWLLACLLGAAFLFQPAVEGYFLSDDYSLLRLVREGGPFVRWDLAGPPAVHFFRPMSTASLWLDLHLWGLRPAGFHITSILLHGLSAFGVSWLFWILARHGQPGHLPYNGAMLAGLLFLIHPSHSEPVAWIAGRADLLAALLAVSALVAYGWYRRFRKPAGLVLTGLLLGPAMLAKESAVALPLVLLAWELLARDRPRRSHGAAIAGVALGFCIAGAYIALRWAALDQWIGGYGVMRHLSAEPLGLARNLFAHLFRSVLPAVPLYLLDTAHPAEALQQLLARPMLAGLVGAGALGLGGLGVVLLVALYRPLRAEATARFLLAAWLICLLPVLTLPVSLRSSEGERFLYLPTMFAVMLIAWVIWETPHRYPARWRRILRGVAPVVLILLYMPTLGLSLLNWQSAGRVARRCLVTLAPGHGAGHSLLLNLPDHLNGAYIFRNGLQDAFALKYAWRSAIPHYHILSRHTLVQPNDEVEVVPRPSGYRLNLIADGATFTHVADPASWGHPVGRAVCVDVPSGDELNVSLGAPWRFDRVYYYTDARFIRLAPNHRVPPPDPNALRLIARNRPAIARRDGRDRNPVDTTRGPAVDPGSADPRNPIPPPARRPADIPRHGSGAPATGTGRPGERASIGP